MLKKILLIVLCSVSVFGQPASGLSDVLERVLPGVVTVAVNETAQAESVFGAASGSAIDSAYSRALDLSEARSSGSGFVANWDGKPYVVTNSHVIASAADQSEIYVYSIDQSRYRTRVVAADSFYDLALLEFVDKAPGKEIRPFAMAKHDIRVGESVYALGNPLGDFPYSVADGIVSARGRTLSGITARLGYLQHTATIIWGNSGGPLITAKGEVAGINTRIHIAGRECDVLQPQINFALEAKVASRVIASMLHNNGRMRRALFGFELEQVLTEEFIGRTLAIPVRLASVQKDMPAAEMAEWVGADIVRIGDRRIRGLDEALEALESVQPGQSTEVEALRRGTSKVFSLKAGEMTAKAQIALVSASLLSAAAATLTETDEGIELTRQAPRSVAEIARPGDGLLMLPLRAVPGGEAKPAGSVKGRVLFMGRRKDERCQFDPVLYRTPTLAEFATAYRLLAVGGSVDLGVLPAASDEPEVLRVSLVATTEERLAMRRILLY